DGVAGPWADLVGHTHHDDHAAPPPSVVAALTTWQQHPDLQPVREGDSRD
ncbi:MAG: hypothetical protein QG608_2432, partial [Actinomycetota bacterium]|nr:hypothetical protein [Actinomycetota bacterium]